MNEWINAWMKEWMNKWMNGCKWIVNGAFISFKGENQFF